MAFSLFGKLKKGAEAGIQKAPAASAGQKTPVEDRISFLIARGLAEPDIIKTLKDEGYSFQEIDSGISNVLKNRVSNEAQMHPEFASSEISPQEDLTPIMNSPDDMQGSPQKIRAEVVEEMDAVMEQLMEEKLSSFLTEFDKIDARFDEVGEKIIHLASRISDVESVRKKYDDKSDAKIEELGSKESGLEPRIAGLERAFKDIIPGLVESIRELKEAVVSKRREASMNEMESGLTLDEHEHGAQAKERRDSNIFD